MGSVLCGCFGDCRKEVDEPDGGKPLKFDADFKGPIRGKSRRPKDLLCLGLFILFIIFFFAIGIYALAKGEPNRLVYPVDSKGRLCGRDIDVADKPFLFFFDLTACISVGKITDLLSGNFDSSSFFTCPTPQVCVTECPTDSNIGLRANPVCLDNINTTQFRQLSVSSSASLGQLILDGSCAPYYIASTDIARRCIPTFVNLDNYTTLILNGSADPALANINITDYVLEDINLQSLLDGTVTQAFLVQSHQFLLDVYEDFTLVWPAILIGVIIAVVLSFIFIVLMRLFAGVVVWTGIILGLLVVVIASGFSYFQFYCLHVLQNGLPSYNSSTEELVAVFNQSIEVTVTACSTTEPLRDFFSINAPWYNYQKETWLAIGIIGTVLFLILLLILIFLGKKIRVSIAIIKEASKAVSGVPSSVVYPLFSWFLLVLIFLYWAVVALFLLTSSVPSYVISITKGSVPPNYTIAGQDVLENNTACDPELFNNGEGETYLIKDPNMNETVAIVTCMFEQFVTSNFLLGLHAYHLFGLFWISNYILALGECALAGGFASYYWAFRKPKDVPTFALFESFGRALLFHSGSLAFGALIIALIQMVRAILLYLQKKLHNKTGRVAKTLLCVLSCCFWLLEKVFRYINRQAYIEIAIYGYDFCTAACKAVKLLLRNIITTAVKDRIVAFLLFLAKIAVAGIVGIIAYLFLGPYVSVGSLLWGGDNLRYFLIPVIVLVISSYLIASGFMSVYHMAVDTIFICALEDLERNNGFDKPYFMSKKLMKILNAHNRVEGPDGPNEVQMEPITGSSREHLAAH